MGQFASPMTFSATPLVLVSRLLRNLRHSRVTDRSEVVGLVRRIGADKVEFEAGDLQGVALQLSLDVDAQVMGFYLAD